MKGTDDKLREAASDVIAWFSKRAVVGWTESEAGLRIVALRAALADSATEDKRPEPTDEMVEDMVENVAQVLWRHRPGMFNLVKGWKELDEWEQDEVRAQARAALAVQQKGEG